MLLSIAVVLIYIPINSGKKRGGAHFSLHPHHHLLLFVLLIIAILTGVRQCGFGFHFLYGQECRAFIQVFIGHLYFLLWELFVQLIFPFIQELLNLCRGNFRNKSSI
jgi:hypothetical protein